MTIAATVSCHFLYISIKILRFELSCIKNMFICCHNAMQFLWVYINDAAIFYSLSQTQIWFLVFRVYHQTCPFLWQKGRNKFSSWKAQFADPIAANWTFRWNFQNNTLSNPSVTVKRALNIRYMISKFPVKHSENSYLLTSLRCAAVIRH